MKKQMAMSTCNPPTPEMNVPKQSFDGKVVVRAVITLFMPLVLFATAGRLDWWQAWVVVALLVFFALLSRVIVMRNYPDLLTERAQYNKHQDVPGWDRVLMPLLALVGPLLVWGVAGLDHRFGWSPPISLLLQWLALSVMILAYVFSMWAMVVNQFFSAVVRIQKERGHTVVTTGPYQYVRHPGYAGGIVATLTMVFFLGSLWALIPAVLTVIVSILRTALEDKTLRAELAGYQQYADRVRYRLLPGVW